MVLRFCLLCGRWLDVAKFAKRTDRGEGAIFPYCYECNQNKLKWNEVKRWEAQGKPRKYKQMPVEGTYLCIRCDERKPAVEFKAVTHGHYVCRDCYKKERASKPRR